MAGFPAPGCAAPILGDAGRAYMAIFGVVAAALIALGVALSQLLERFFLGLFDRFLGALLGIALTLTLAASALFPPLLAGRPGFVRLIRRSAFAPYVMRTSQKYLNITPAALWERLEPSLEDEEVFRVRKLLESGAKK